jgi:hypothetical protein
VGRGVIFGFNISYCTLLSAIFLTAIGALIFIRYDYPEMLGASSLSAVMLIFGFIVSAAFFLKRMYLGSFSMIALAVMLFLYPVGRFVIPQIERHESSKEIARNLLRYMKPGEKLGSESHYLSGLAFYTDKVPVNMDPHHILVQFLESEKRVWFVLKEKNHIQIYTLDTPPFCRRPSYAVYKLGKKVIATNMVPDDGRYIIKRERKE